MKETVLIRVAPETAKKVEEIRAFDPEKRLTRIQVYGLAVNAMHKKIFGSSTKKCRCVVGVNHE